MNEHVADTSTNSPTRATTPPPRKRSGPLQEIAVERPRCPRCNGVHLGKYRSIADQGDGTALWWVKCRNASCSHRFRVLLE